MSNPTPPAAPPMLVISTGGIEPLRVAVFDDVVAARGEVFHIPGLAVDVYAHADEAVAQCRAAGHALVFMDFAMGSGRADGAAAVAALRADGFGGRIVAISSDPAANAAMIAAGANEALGKKAHLRSFLVHVAGQHVAAQRGA